MLTVQRFNPYLTGSVLDGTAGRHAEIDIQLFTTVQKMSKFFCSTSGLIAEHSEPRSDRAEAVLTIHNADATINLIVPTLATRRVTFRSRDGRVRQRMRTLKHWSA